MLIDVGVKVPKIAIFMKQTVEEFKGYYDDIKAAVEYVKNEQKYDADAKKCHHEKKHNPVGCYKLIFGEI